MDENISMLKILQICDSLFPIGGFTLSNGLETYVQKGLISTPAELNEYLCSYISLLPFGELGAAAMAFKADEETLVRLDEIYTAAKSACEVRSGSQKMAKRFFRLMEVPENGTAALYRRLIKNGDAFGHQCIAYGAYIGDCGAPLEESLRIYGYSICSAIVTNCVKLVPLSQIDGQRVLYGCFEGISGAARLSLGTSLEEIGIGGAGFELRAMQHEKLYSRQYMS